VNGNVGVNVREVDGLASPAIAGAPTSVAAFLGPTERGIPHQPVRVTDLDQFRRHFGTLADGYLAPAVAGFFGNGGREAYVCRVTGPTGVAATATLPNRTQAGPALLVTAGYRGRTDPGPWGNALRVEVRDAPLGSSTIAAEVSSPAGAAVLESLDGFTTGSVVRITVGTDVFHRVLTSADPVTRGIGWATPINRTLGKGTAVVSGEFSLTVERRDPATGAYAVVEQWAPLSMRGGSANYVVDRVNHPYTGSGLVTVTDLSGATADGDENPAAGWSYPLTGGTEAAPAAGDFTGELPSLDTLRIQLLCAPDAHRLSGTERDLVVRAAIDYCASRGDCLYVGSAPDRAARVTGPRTVADYLNTAGEYVQLESEYVAAVQTYARTFHGSKVYGALYAPWIQIADPAATGTAPTRFVPPDGHVLGLYARTEQEENLWKAPAGVGAQLRGAVDVSARLLDTQHDAMARGGLVNGIRPLPGAGITVAASRTLSTDTRWRFVNVRLLFNFVKSSLRDGLRFARQEPHSPALRQSVSLNVVRPFLLGLYAGGAFGSGDPDELFTIRCDAGNNPPAQVDLGVFTIEIYFYPVKPAETITIVVGQQPAGASASES
jgi:phage tail sheath protein FI